MARKVVLAAVLVLVLAAVTAGIAIAAGGVSAVGIGDDEPALAGATLEQATAAALEHTGGGTVTESEAGDDGAAYGVEVRLPDGSQVEVSLDENFGVIGEEADGDEAGDEDEDEDKDKER